MLLALVSPLLAAPLINEVLYEPAGTNTTSNQWIELCNPSGTSVDLAGYEIWAGGASASKIGTITAGTLAGRGYAVVGGPSPTVTATMTGTMQVGGSETDVVYLKAPGGSSIVDALFYDSPNTNGLLDEAGRAATSFAVDVTDDHSLGRWPDCTDTNAPAVDFSDYGTPTRGTANVAPSTGGGGGGGGTTADCTGSADVLINEFLADPSGSDTGNEWVEIYNAGRSSVNLAGWQLQWDTSSWTGASSFSVPAGTTLAAGGYLVIGAGGISASLSLGNAGSSADGVRLACNGSAADTVVYGTPNSDALTDDRGTAATSLAPKPASGQSIARLPNGTDTDASATDFSLSTSPTPGAANTSGGGGSGGSTADCTGAVGVKINEFTPDSGVEFVEIYNGGSTSVNLEGWEVAFGTSSYSRSAVVADGVRLAPGDYYVVGSAGAPTKDQTVELDLGNASSNSDALRLECGDTVVDTIIYGKEGTPNEDGWDDDLVADTTSICVMPGDGESASRVQDGYDTDRSASDFVVGAPTPGAANPRVEPPVCETNTGARIVLNEVLYDPDSTDADHEWVELYNAGNASTRLDGWSVETATSAWGEDFVFSSGVELAPGDFLVVGGSGVAEADHVSEDLSLGNGTRADGVRIVDCEGGVVDTVLYGDTLGDPITGDAGSTEVVTGVDSAMSIGRYPDGADTNGMADWKGYAAPSPGASNADPGGSSDTAGGAGGDVPGGGCGEDAPDDGSRPDGGGCTTVPTRVSFAGLLAMLSMVLVGRRKR